MEFRDRADAGRRLAGAVSHLADEDAVVLGLPRGGVAVAYEVARALGAPLDVIVVRKLGVPHQPELALAAIGEGGVRVVNEEVIRITRTTEDELAVLEQAERAELERRAERFRGARRRVPVTGRTAVVVDDGIATGATARAACQVARASGARRVVLAVPVAPPSAPAEFRADADEVVVLEMPRHFYAVGQWYEDFAQVSDDEVVGLLAAGGRPPGGAGTDGCGRDEDVEVPAGAVRLAGHLAFPPGAAGIVVFAHGSGSSRNSPRNRFVARMLGEAGLGTVLFDLLTPAEEADRHNVFDIGLLADRLAAVTRWVLGEPEAAGARVGYFGASTGAAAALVAAAGQPGAGVSAVVSRGGRPDLAGAALERVRAPTLLLVGGNDAAVLDLNRRALARLRCPNELVVVPGATHLFEEEGTLEAVARHARDWFHRHLTQPRSPAESGG